MKIRNLLVGMVLILATMPVVAQNLDMIKKDLIENHEFKSSDLESLIVTKSYPTKHNGAMHVYASQSIDGIKIINSSLTAVFDAEGNLLNVAPRLFRNVGAQHPSSQPSVSAVEAASIVAGNMINGVQTEALSGTDKVLFITASGYTFETPVELVFLADKEENFHLVWKFYLDMPDQSHYWAVFASAMDGSIVRKHDLQISCDHGHTHFIGDKCEPIHFGSFETTEDGSGYRVFELPIESPNHGERTLISEPALDAASPFGWHDTDGVDGAEYTITRGNNVYAYEDVDDQDNPGFSPDGGENLLFDFNYVPENGPNSYQSASLTNLFYMNNRIHDLLYIYGFDEASGNFQQTNYTGEGFGNDAVQAEGQDGGGTNNANFATPGDGMSGRMQMYLWSSDDVVDGLLTINSPESIAGGYSSSAVSSFGADVPLEGITADLVYAEDGAGADMHDLCEPAINSSEIEGKIALVQRGNCNFTNKVLAVQEAGAVACIVINYENTAFEMGGTTPDEINIPSIMITVNDGNTLLDELENGPVNATLGNIGSGSSVRDGSFDNGVVVHEYVHGLSNRLTGGDNVFCLTNEEQMGEGWSDWYATMITMDMSVENPVYRPMGTFAAGQATDGNGIRPAPYDTSFAINDYTYGNLPDGNITVPHGVGFVWGTMLWDLTWAFIDEYGFDNLETGIEGGNNIVMQLVTDGLKLQPCSPGFVDGRDAILLADEINNDGANQCLIWRVFAKRGLGYSASQGSSDNRNDGVEAFDLPPVCQLATAAPVAAFSATPTSTCLGFVEFTDLTQNIAQTWLWDFGDGNTSTEQNPTHQYENEGTYTVSLTVSNNIGEDSVEEIDFIVYQTPEMPTEALGGEGCEGDLVTLTATSESEILWTDEDGVSIGIGSEIEVEVGSESATYFAQSVVDFIAPEFVGPENGSIGGGGLHNSAFVGTVDFTTEGPVTIVSAWVNSGAPGQRIINLWDDAGGIGNLLGQYPVDIDFTGGDRVQLNIEIPSAGTYSIGLNEANLFRNEEGVTYPYSESGLFTIIGSSAGEDYYYYFYDLEVAVTNCVSEAVEVSLTALGNADFSADVVGTTVNFTDLSDNASSWEWNFGDGNTSNEQNPIHTYTQDGVYYVTLTTDGGCSYGTEVLIITTGLEAFKDVGASIYPNPATTHIRIETGALKDVVFVSFYSAQGKLAKRERLSNNETFELSVGNLSNGFYVVVLENQNGSPIAQEKISIVH